MISSGIFAVLLFGIICYHGNTVVGAEPLNITYVNDMNSCPKSQARWRDFTVHLMTVPGICFVRISWNARYKRIPHYHRTWWGIETTYTYKVVYDPDVEFEDLKYKLR